jgi:hypothetical protein
MNAAEIIEMIKKLSLEEQAQVMAFLREREETVVESGRVEETKLDPNIAFLSEAEAEKRATRIFRENHELFRRLAQ